jgi:hypothetical protein
VTEWISATTGELVEAEDAPGPEWVQADEVPLGEDLERPRVDRLDPQEAGDWLTRAEARDRAELDALARQHARRVRQVEARSARRRYLLGPVVADYVRAIVCGKSKGKFVDFQGGRVVVRSSTRSEVTDEAAALAAGPPEAAVKVVPETRRLLVSGLPKGAPWPGVARVTTERVAIEGGPVLYEREVERVKGPLSETEEAAPVVEDPPPKLRDQIAEADPLAGEPWR